MSLKRRQRVAPPYTARAKLVLEYAADEARRLGHPFVGTHHLLLALLREGEGIGMAVLVNLDVDLTLESARRVTARLTGTGKGEA